MPALELAPSILSCNFSQFRKAVEQMVSGGADWIHFDVMDGQFVPPITFGSQLVADLRGVGKVGFEVHLMTLTPENHFEDFVKAGATRVIYHIEATAHAHRLAQQLKSMGVQAGIALNPSTHPSAVESILDVVDEVLVMTVNPGWGGQSFIETALQTVRRIRELRPDIAIEVDGGIDPKTLPLARDAGANVFVAGSYVTKGGNIEGALRELRKACEQRS